jgi:hypothetical protein
MAIFTAGELEERGCRGGWFFGAGLGPGDEDGVVAQNHAVFFFEFGDFNCVSRLPWLWFGKRMRSVGLRAEWFCIADVGAAISSGDRPMGRQLLMRFCQRRTGFWPAHRAG